MASKLEGITREAPANFHAPQGYKSLKNGPALAKGHKPSSVMPGTAHHVAPARLAGPVGQRKDGRQVLTDKVLNRENERIKTRFNEIYSSTRPSIAPRNIGPAAVDCTERWQRRTSLYTPPAGPSTSGGAGAGTGRGGKRGTAPRAQTAPGNPGAVGGGSHRRPPSPPPRLPKTIAHARCAGCARSKFRGADGPPLIPCGKCGQVYYCSGTCAQVDAQSHKQVCAFYTNGVWAAGGKRPEEDYWVNNGAMAAARKELRARMAGGGPMSEEEAFDVRDHIAAVEAAEKAKERQARATQKHIEYLADNGMDGPRPCMYNGGKRM
ncbi:hypothetical protein FOA52_003785 [Chlamydomonas sp. UWO 241]|nr:hypothetical protein FOA52_003785 [Chlamydomonas sp. UWO 241]